MRWDDSALDIWLLGDRGNREREGERGGGDLKHNQIPDILGPIQLFFCI